MHEELSCDGQRAVTTAEAAERLGISKRTVERMVKRGELPVLRIGDSARSLPAREADQVLVGPLQHRLRPSKVEVGLHQRRRGASLAGREEGAVAFARVGGEIVDPRRLPTLGELSVDYLKERMLTKKAGKEDASRWRVLLAPWFADKLPGEVDADLIHR